MNVVECWRVEKEDEKTKGLFGIFYFVCCFFSILRLLINSDGANFAN